jgi:glycosyltransferase involved in cell wall biosynthesis
MLHPTIYDSFGLVVAEAMAHGVPSVVSEHAGISELIEHKVSGWIVTGDAVSGFGDALAQLFSDDGLRRSWDTVAEETLAAYELVANR